MNIHIDDNSFGAIVIATIAVGLLLFSFFLFSMLEHNAHQQQLSRRAHTAACMQLKDEKFQRDCLSGIGTASRPAYAP